MYKIYYPSTKGYLCRCLQNAENIRALPQTGPDRAPAIALVMHELDEIVNIIDLPASVDKVSDTVKITFLQNT